MRDPVVLWTASEQETRALGWRLAAALQGGERLALAGDLGTGKTCLVRGLAEGLGIAPDQVRSPSFPIVLPYEGGRLPLFHIDLFRMPAGDIDSLALREYIYGAGVAAIEWYEHLDEPLRDFVEIAIEFAGAERRRVQIRPHGAEYADIMAVVTEISSNV